MFARFFDISSSPHRDFFSQCRFPWDPILNLEDYFVSFFRRVKAQKFDTSKYPGVTFVKEDLIYMEANVKLEPGAYIQGPAILGEGTQIRHGAYLRGFVLTERNVIIGHTTEVKNSLLLERAAAAHFAYIGDSILGKDVNLGAGTKLSNLRLNRAPIEVLYENEHFITGRKKLGAIIGDGVQIGCNAVLNPGTLIGKQANIFPCVNAGGYIPEKSTVQPTSFPKIVTAHAKAY